MDKERVLMYAGVISYWTIVAILFVMCLFPGTAKASGNYFVEGGFGRTKFHLRECGIWYQCGPTNVTNNSLIGNGYNVDLRWTESTASRWLRGFKVGYHYLGEFRGRNIATVVDADADKPRGKCDPTTSENCLSWYLIDGTASGWAFGPTIAYRAGKQTMLEAEFGAFYFRSKNNVQVIRFEGATDCNGTPCEFAYNHSTGTHLTWYVGYSIAYGDRIRFSVRFYNNVYEQGRGPEGQPGITGGRWTVEKMITVKLLEF